MDKGDARPKPVMFKRVTGGWVYRAPNPGVFGDAPHYLVNDEQKAQIEAIIVPRRPVLFGTMLVAVIFAWVFALVGLVWVISGHNEPTTADVIAITVLVVVSLVAAVLLANWTQRRRLRPVLAGLPLTQERITLAEIRKSAETATPFKQSRNAYVANVFTSFSAAGAVASHLIAKSSLDAHVIIWTFNAIVFGSLAFVWYRRALRKTTESSPDAGRVEAASFVRLSRIVLLIAVSGLALLIAVLKIQRDHFATAAPDYAIMRVHLEAAAKAGDAEAMNRLGWLHQAGLGGAQDYVTAREWYEKAAAAGSSASMNGLGWIYQNGLGIGRDYVKAKEWFDKGAASGNSVAMSNLGSLYQFGWGVPQDYAKAKEWFEKSSAAGNIVAMGNLGWLYQKGSGVPQDYAKARELYEKAATKGIGASMDALGTLYINGLGVTQSDEQARDWYEKAAAAGNTPGMQHLASMLDAGKGGPADSVRAAGLLLQSAKLGHKRSVSVLNGPLTFLTPSTRVELKRELARLGHYSGPIDDRWDAAARAAATAYLDAPR